MHSSISITDGIYGGLSIDDIASKLNKLVVEDIGNPENTEGEGEILKLLNQIMYLLNRDNPLAK